MSIDNEENDEAVAAQGEDGSSSSSSACTDNIRHDDDAGEMNEDQQEEQAEGVDESLVQEKKLKVIAAHCESVPIEAPASEAAITYSCCSKSNAVSCSCITKEQCTTNRSDAARCSCCLTSLNGEIGQCYCCSLQIPSSTLRHSSSGGSIPITELYRNQNIPEHKVPAYPGAYHILPSGSSASRRDIHDNDDNDAGAGRGERTHPHDMTHRNEQEENAVPHSEFFCFEATVVEETSLEDPAFSTMPSEVVDSDAPQEPALVFAQVEPSILETKSRTIKKMSLGIIIFLVIGVIIILVLGLTGTFESLNEKEQQKLAQQQQPPFSPSTLVRVREAGVLRCAFLPNVFDEETNTEHIFYAILVSKK